MLILEKRELCSRLRGVGNLSEKLEAKTYLQEILLLIPNLVKLLYRLLEDKRVPAQEKVILGAAAVYVASPIDLVPDFIPFIGQLDDLLLVALVLKRFLNSVDESILLEHWDGPQDLLKMVDTILSCTRFFLPAGVYNRLVNQVRKGIDVDYEVHSTDEKD